MTLVSARAEKKNIFLSPKTKEKTMGGQQNVQKRGRVAGVDPRGVAGGASKGGRKPRTGGSKAENWRVKSREMEGQKPRNGGSKAENWVPPRDSALAKRYTHAGSSTCRSPGVTPMRVPAPAAHQALLPCGFQHLPLTRRYSHAGPGACHSPDATPMRVPCSALP